MVAPMLLLFGLCFVIGHIFGEAKAVREVFRRQGQTEEQIKENIRKYHDYRG